MAFLQKNKSILVILLMVSFLAAILLVFISGINDSNSNSSPTQDAIAQPAVLTTSTIDVTPRPTAAQGQAAPLATTQESAADSEESEGEVFVDPIFLTVTAQSSVTETFVEPDILPPPTDDIPILDDLSPGTDFPPPDVIEDLPTETPPPGNGPPPGS